MEDKVNTAGYYITGSSVEKEEHVKSDKLLLNTIENERIERMESHKETINELGELAMNDVVILKQLRKFEITLKAFLVVEIILLIAMMIVNL